MIRPPPVLPARRRRRGTRPAFRGHAAASRASPLAGVPSLRARRATPPPPPPPPPPGGAVWTVPAGGERGARAAAAAAASSVAASAASRGSHLARASASATALRSSHSARHASDSVASGTKKKEGDVADVAVFSNAQTRGSNANASDDSANESASASRSRSVHDALPRSLANRPAPSAHSCARGAHARTASAVAPARWSVLFKTTRGGPVPVPVPIPVQERRRVRRRERAVNDRRDAVAARASPHDEPAWARLGRIYVGIRHPCRGAIGIRHPRDRGSRVAHQRRPRHARARVRDGVRRGDVAVSFGVAVFASETLFVPRGGGHRARRAAPRERYAERYASRLRSFASASIATRARERGERLAHQPRSQERPRSRRLRRARDEVRRPLGFRDG